MYINTFAASAAPSAAFYVFDLVEGSGKLVRAACATRPASRCRRVLTGAAWQVPASFAEALGMAIRYQEPVLVGRDALLAAQADWLSRMLLAFSAGGDAAGGAAPEEVAALAALAARWNAASSSAAACAQVRLPAARGCCSPLTQTHASSAR